MALREKNLLTAREEIVSSNLSQSCPGGFLQFSRWEMISDPRLVAIDFQVCVAGMAAMYLANLVYIRLHLGSQGELSETDDHTCAMPHRIAGVRFNFFEQQFLNSAASGLRAFVAILSPFRSGLQIAGELKSTSRHNTA